MQLFLGCAWLGAPAVPINISAKAPQVRYYLEDAGARLLVIEHALLAGLRDLDVSGLALDCIWIVGERGSIGLNGIKCVALPDLGPAAASTTVRPSDTVAIMYTSGTTGPSKGVCCPHAQMYWWGVNTADVLEIDANDVLSTTLPLFHTNALNCFAQALVTGATQIVEPRFSASRFWSTLIARRATVTYLLGAMVPILLSRDPSPEEKRHTVRIALGPGAPAKLHEEFFERTGIRLLEAYGSTETNLAIGGVIRDQRNGTMGRVRPGFQALVVGPDDIAVASGEPGELVLRADEAFSFATGYFGMPEKTVEAWRNLWFHTGDRVACDEDGYFRFVDRMKDSIRRRGENVSSYEVEQVLHSHPAIEIAAVFPARSELAEDEVMAAVVIRAGEKLSPEELLNFCEPRLPYFAVPRFIEFVDDLPRTESGKVQKFKLRERGVTTATWNREAAGLRLKRS